MDQEVLLQMYADRCEAGCVHWCKNNGEEGRVALLTMLSETLVPLSNKKELSADEGNTLIIYQMAMNGLSVAWNNAKGNE